MGCVVVPEDATVRELYAVVLYTISQDDKFSDIILATSPRTRPNTQYMSMFGAPVFFLTWHCNPKRHVFGTKHIGDPCLHIWEHMGHFVLMFVAQSIPYARVLTENERNFLYKSTRYRIINRIDQVLNHDENATISIQDMRKILFSAIRDHMMFWLRQIRPFFTEVLLPHEPDEAHVLYLPDFGHWDLIMRVIIENPGTYSRNIIGRIKRVRAVVIESEGISLFVANCVNIPGFEYAFLDSIRNTTYPDTETKTHIPGIISISSSGTYAFASSKEAIVKLCKMIVKV